MIELECFGDSETIICNLLITKIIKPENWKVKELDPGHKPIEILKIKSEDLDADFTLKIKLVTFSSYLEYYWDHLVNNSNSEVVIYFNPWFCKT